MLRFVGIGALGNMLSPAAIHLSKGNPLGSFIRILDHSPMNADKQDRRDSWLQHGAKLVTSMEELIGQGDFDGVVICAGKNGDDLTIIAQVLQKISQQYSSDSRPFILHCSTVSTEFVEKANAACRQLNVAYANYPLTGGAKGAKEGTMLILASGDLALYQKLQPLLSLLGKPKYFDHNILTAAKVKFMGHLMVFNGLLGMSSALTLQERSLNLDAEQQTEFFDFLNQGAGGSRQWDVTLKPAIANDQWRVGFLLPHAVIDAVYTADLLIKSGMPSSSVVPILTIAATFSLLLQEESAKYLATQTILKALHNTEDLNAFIERLQHKNLDVFLHNIVHSLPPYLQEKVKIDVATEEFFETKD